MADSNLEEDHSEENIPPGESIEPAAAVETENSLENINNNNTEMEVHHHAHHDHGKKSWRTYFWEFLMLFLAVFCGSLAEYQLEHYVEKQRAKDFAHSLHQDLAVDTAGMRLTTVRLNFCISKMDTLLTILGDTKHLEENTPRIYQLSVYAFILPLRIANESTLQQLLNSGALRYFKNEALVDSIKRYNNDVQSLKRFSESAADLNIDFRKQQLGIIDIEPVINYIPKINTALEQFKPEPIDPSFNNMPLLTSDPLKIKQYANWCSLKKFYMKNSVAYYLNVLKSGKAVLAILDK